MCFEGLTDDISWIVGGHVLANRQKKNFYAVVMKRFGQRSSKRCGVQGSAVYDDKYDSMNFILFAFCLRVEVRLNEGKSVF